MSDQLTIILLVVTLVAMGVVIGVGFKDRDPITVLVGAWVAGCAGVTLAVLL